MWSSVIAAGQIALFLGLPALVLLGCRYSAALRAISPVVLCYLLGILAGNLLGLDVGVAEPGGLSPAEELTGLIAGAAVLLALAALLASTDFVRWLRLAPVTLLGSSLAIVSIVAVAGGSALALRGLSPELWKVAGMLVGVYSGGTVNLAAIARGLDVDAVTWGVVHTSDVIVTGLWFLVLLAVGPRLYGSFLKRIREPASSSSKSLEECDDKPRTWQIFASIGVAIGLVAPAIGLSELIGAVVPSLSEPTAILGATTIAIGASFIPWIRRLPGLYATGDYLLLVFCVAVGSLATWGRLSQAEPSLLAFTALVVVLAVALHAGLCWLFGVDRDTAIITSVAALYGPPFVPPVARVLKNREIVVSGVTSGLVGLAAGNYLGLGVAYAVRWLGG